MATNKFLPFAAGDSANVMSDAEYASALAPNGAFEKGVSTGQASSQQANKTWRQSSLAAASLAQFIVDCLSVDVSDGDTLSTFSSRLTNTVIKLSQISRFNPAFAKAIGGYPAGAIVCDATVGTFWVSTAENNVTVPGADGASWQSLFSGYATSAALASETQRASTVESNLQQSKVNRAGDTMTGPLNINTSDGQGINAIGQSAASDGVYTSPALKTGISGTSQAYFQYEFLSGKYARLGIFVRDADSLIEFYLSPNGRITTSSSKTFAWLDDLPDLSPYAKKTDLPDLSPYALKSYFDSGPITGGQYVRNGNVLTQSFNTYLSTSGFSGTISFPISFSETPTCVLLTNSDDGDMDMWANRANWTANGCIVQTPQGKANGQISVYAQGLVS